MTYLLEDKYATLNVQVYEVKQYIPYSAGGRKTRSGGSAFVLKGTVPHFLLSVVSVSDLTR